MERERTTRPTSPAGTSRPRRALYAKNPKAVAKRADDGLRGLGRKRNSLMMAFQTLQAWRQRPAAGRRDAARAVIAMGQLVPAPAICRLASIRRRRSSRTSSRAWRTASTSRRSARRSKSCSPEVARRTAAAPFKDGDEEARPTRLHDRRRLYRARLQRETGPRPGLSEQLADARRASTIWSAWLKRSRRARSRKTTPRWPSSGPRSTALTERARDRACARV
jgi:hypothetical protein